MNGHHTNGNGTTLTPTNGHTTTNNNCTESNWNLGIWSVGVINAKNKRYLTAETFGYKINANGTSLKKKQTWRLEPAGADGICLKSHLDRYLAVDQYGNVTCDQEEKEHGAFFEVVASGKEGTWTLRNTSRGYYLGAESDKLICTSKIASTLGEKWFIHLAARPQVTLKSVGRKRYAHLAENEEEIHVDSNVPWGADTLFTLEFRFGDSCFYALHTCNNKYLRSDGKLQDACDPSCLFSIEYHHGQMALRDSSGLYLAPIGSKAVLKTRSHTVTKDELFVLEDSVPQGAFVAKLNGRYVSTKQGVDVTANQDEISSFETFQLEFEPKSKKWYVRTMQDKYWTVVEATGGIQAGGDKRTTSSLFTLKWSPGGTLYFMGCNGKYVGAKRSGHLYANVESPEEDESAQFHFYLINRPILVLKCEQGYVGYKSNGLFRLECNKASYETIGVERKESGVVHFKGQKGKYWSLAGDEIAADSDTPTDFYIELKEPNRICIKTGNGLYLNAEKNGMFKVGASSEPTLWEF
ncbi:protein singed isoform X2 [Folsomia candida]|nr:protein singed isoform X2 [Folsomia candida]